MATKLIIRGADFAQNAIVSQVTLNNDTPPVVQFDDGYYVNGNLKLSYDMDPVAKLIYLDISEYTGCQLSFTSGNARRWALYSSIDWLLSKVTGTPVDLASGFSIIENDDVTNHIIQSDEKYLVAVMYLNGAIVNNTIVIDE